MRNPNTKPKKAFKKDRPEHKPLDQLSQQDLINEGYRNPYFVKPDFSKTPEERKRLKKVHTNKKGPTGSGKKSFGLDIPQRLTVHVKFKRDVPGFKTTHSFMVRPSAMNQVLIDLFHMGDDHKDRMTKITFGSKLIRG